MPLMERRQREHSTVQASALETARMSCEVYLMQGLTQLLCSAGDACLRHPERPPAEAGGL